MRKAKKRKQLPKGKTTIVIEDEGPSPQKKRRTSIIDDAPHKLSLLVISKEQPQRTFSMVCIESELPSWEEVDSFIRNEVGLQDFNILDENMCQLVKASEWQNYPFEAAIVQESGGTNIALFLRHSYSCSISTFAMVRCCWHYPWRGNNWRGKFVTTSYTRP